MKKNFLNILLLLLTFVFVLTSCNSEPEHTHAYGEWMSVLQATCQTDGAEARYCSCGAEERKTIPASNYHSFGGWTTTKEATCTQDGSKTRKCSLCDETETIVIEASHSYTKGVCTVCGEGVIDITLPTTPITINRKSTSGFLFSTCEVTSIRWEIGSELYKDSISVYWSGIKTYDYKGDSAVTNNCAILCQLYDSEGYIVYSGSCYVNNVKVGDKFKDQRINISNLDPNESYTLVLEDDIIA